MEAYNISGFHKSAKNGGMFRKKVEAGRKPWFLANASVEDGNTVKTKIQLRDSKKYESGKKDMRILKKISFVILAIMVCAQVGFIGTSFQTTQPVKKRFLIHYWHRSASQRQMPQRTTHSKTTVALLQKLNIIVKAI